MVELNDRFVEILRHRFAHHADYRPVSACSAVHHLPLQEFKSDAAYDFIISGLPLNNFPVPLVEEVFGCYFNLLKPGGVLSYFEYMYVRPMRRIVSKGDERDRLANLEAIFTHHLGNHRFRRDWVFVNMPPAWVQHLKIDGVEK